MPKFNEFIKSFEEKETAPQAQEPQVQTAPKAEEPKDKGTPQTPARTFKPLSKAEAEDMRKGGFTEDKYRYNQAKDYAIAMGEQIPDKRKFTQELGEWKEANKQKAQPAPQKQEENVAKQESVPQQKSDFKPTEPVEKYNDRYNAMTHSEREFNLEATNDKGMYDYVTKNLASLKELAETNPEGAIREITKHGNYPASYYNIEPNNIRKEYVKAVLDGFAEDQESTFNPTEPIEEYDDLYGAMTKSEREFNLETSNDRGMYEYVKANLPTLQKLAQTNPEAVIRAITTHGNYPRSFYGIEPKNVRKEYIQAVLNGFLED